MVLDNIKLQTTWNDAAGSINSNFTKLLQAIASLEGGGGGGIITSITYDMVVEALGYIPYNANNPNGYITANAIPTKVSDFDNDAGYATESWVDGRGYQLSSGLGNLAYKNSLVASDIPDLSGKYIPKVGGRASDLTIEGSGTAWLAFGNSSGTSFGSIGVNSSHEPKFWNGSGASTIYHSGNFNPADYLPLSGGTISGTTNGPLNINTSNASEIGLSLSINSSKKAWFGYNTTLGTTQGAAYMYNAVAKRYMGILDDGSAFLGGSTLIHSGNYSDYALPLSGGTLNATSTRVLTINRTNGNNSFIFFKGVIDGATQDLGYLGFSGINTPVFYTAAGQTNNLLHSGNVGEYAPVRKARQSTIDLNTVANGYYEVGYSTQTATNTPSDFGNNASLLIDVRDANGYAKIQLLGQNAPSKLWFRAQQGVGSEITSAWKLLAFTDSNVASAQALVHSNGTVGATVASSGRVDFSGNIALALNKSILDPSGRSIFMLDSNNSPQIGYDTVGSYSTFINGRDVYLRYGSSRTTGLILNSSGNVTIGNGDFAGTSTKLYVGGSGYFGADIYLANWAYLRSYKTDGSKVSVIGINNNNLLLINGVDSGVNTAILGGEVGIGTTDPAYKLDVNGTFNSNALRTDSAAKAFWGTSYYYGILSWDTTYASVMAKSGLALRLGVGVTPYITIASDGAVTMESTLSVAAGITSKKLLTTGEYGIWRGDAFTGSLTQNDIAYNASRHAFYGDVRINGNLVVTGDIASA